MGYSKNILRPVLFQCSKFQKERTRIIATDLVTVIQNGGQVSQYKGTAVLDAASHQDLRVTSHIALQFHKEDFMKIRFKDIQIKEPVPQKTVTGADITSSAISKLAILFRVDATIKIIAGVVSQSGKILKR